MMLLLLYWGLNRVDRRAALLQCPQRNCRPFEWVCTCVWKVTDRLMAQNPFCLLFYFAYSFDIVIGSVTQILMSIFSFALTICQPWTTHRTHQGIGTRTLTRTVSWLDMKLHLARKILGWFGSVGSQGFHIVRAHVGQRVYMRDGGRNVILYEYDHITLCVIQLVNNWIKLPITKWRIRTT